LGLGLGLESELGMESGVVVLYVDVRSPSS
jgi:hypothetical protein